LAAAPAAARAQVLNFEGIGGGGKLDNPFIQNFYNGGVSSDLTTGTNFGISFSANAVALCLNTLAIQCSNSSRGGLGDPTSSRGGLDFLLGDEAFMDRAGGFTTGFSFFYSQPIAANGSFSVYDGLDGTGNLLGSLDLGLTPQGKSGACPGYVADFCPFVAAGLTFSGTAMSVVFTGVNDQVTFDDVTFGSATPGGGPGGGGHHPGGGVVPEPTTMSLLAMGLVGMVGFRRRRTK
jgi:hypothetical protein